MGLFSPEPDPNGTCQYYIFWNRTEKYWHSVKELSLSHVTEEENEIKIYGKWNQFWSEPREQCEVYAYCGAFGSCNQNSLPFYNCLQGFELTSESDWQLNDSSRGCSRKTDLLCENRTSSKERDQFWTHYCMSFPQDAVSMVVGSSGECESACLSNCSCTAYVYDDNGCSIWIGDLLNVKQLSVGDSDGRTLYIRLAASEFPGSSNKKIIGFVMGCVAGIAAALCLLLVVWQKKGGKSRPPK
ncbi:hypothetical protein Ancab_007942 [Ancistrocladus abbreviatus]